MRIRINCYTLKLTLFYTLGTECVRVREEVLRIGEETVVQEAFLLIILENACRMDGPSIVGCNNKTLVAMSIHLNKTEIKMCTQAQA